MKAVVREQRRPVVVQYTRSSVSGRTRVGNAGSLCRASLTRAMIAASSGVRTGMNVRPLLATVAAGYIAIVAWRMRNLRRRLPDRSVGVRP